MPILPAGGGPLQKAEALVRWNHPQRGRIMPGEMIPLAEESRLIIDLTDLVLDLAVHILLDIDGGGLG